MQQESSVKPQVSLGVTQRQVCIYSGSIVLASVAISVLRKNFLHIQFKIVRLVIDEFTSIL